MVQKDNRRMDVQVRNRGVLSYCMVQWDRRMGWVSALVAFWMGTALADDLRVTPDALSPEAQAALVVLRQYEGDDAGFQRAATEAIRAGVPESMVDFLRLQFAIFTGHARLLEEALHQAMERREELDRLVGGSGQCRAYLALARARLAEVREDHEAVRRGYMEAFWASPRDAGLVASFAARYQRRQFLAELRLPVDVSLRRSDGGATTLQEELGEHRLLLLDFWASWCVPCMQRMPELKAFTTQMEGQGLVVVSLNVGETEVEAEEVRLEHGMRHAWLLDTPDQLYHGLIANESLPHQLLVNREGEVLFDGHPNDPALREVLERLGIAMEP